MILCFVELLFYRRHFFLNFFQQRFETWLQDLLRVVTVTRSSVAPRQHLGANVLLAEGIGFLHELFLVHHCQSFVGRKFLGVELVRQRLPHVMHHHGKTGADFLHTLVAVPAEYLRQLLLSTVNFRQLRLDRFERHPQLFGIGLKRRLSLANLLFHGRRAIVGSFQKAIDVHALPLINQEFAELALESRQL